MEDEIGAALFDRSSRRIKLTAEGQTLLRHCHQILSEWGQARHSIQEMINLDRGHLRLITFVTFAFYLLPNFIMDFIRTHPNIDVEIEQAVKEPVVRAVLEHQFDAGITTLPVGHPKLDEIPLYIEESALIVNKDHPLHGREEIQASEVGEHLIVTSSLNATYREFLHSVFQDLDVQLNVRYVVHYYPLVIQMVKAGVGAGLVPVAALSSLSEKDVPLSVIHINPPLQRTLGWIEPRGTKRTFVTNAFFSFLVKYLNSHGLVPPLISCD